MNVTVFISLSDFIAFKTLFGLGFSKLVRSSMEAFTFDSDANRFPNFAGLLSPFSEENLSGFPTRLSVSARLNRGDGD